MSNLSYFPYDFIDFSEQRVRKFIKRQDISNGYIKIGKFFFLICSDNQCQTLNKSFSIYCRNCGQKISSNKLEENIFSIEKEEVNLNNDKLETIETPNSRDKVFLLHLMELVLFIDEYGAGVLFNLDKELNGSNFSKIPFDFNKEKIISNDETIIDIKTNMTDLFILTNKYLKSFPLYLFTTTFNFLVTNFNSPYIEGTLENYIKEKIIILEESSFSEDSELVIFGENYIVLKNQSNIISNIESLKNSNSSKGLYEFLNSSKYFIYGSSIYFLSSGHLLVFPSNHLDPIQVDFGDIKDIYCHNKDQILVLTNKKIIFYNITNKSKKELNLDYEFQKIVYPYKKSSKVFLFGKEKILYLDLENFNEVAKYDIENPTDYIKMKDLVNPCCFYSENNNLFYLIYYSESKVILINFDIEKKEFLLKDTKDCTVIANTFLLNRLYHIRYHDKKTSYLQVLDVSSV